MSYASSSTSAKRPHNPSPEPYRPARGGKRPKLAPLVLHGPAETTGEDELVGPAGKFPQSDSIVASYRYLRHCFLATASQESSFVNPSQDPNPFEGNSQGRSQPAVFEQPEDVPVATQESESSFSQPSQDYRSFTSEDRWSNARNSQGSSEVEEVEESDDGQAAPQDSSSSGLGQLPGPVGRNSQGTAELGDSEDPDGAEAVSRGPSSDHPIQDPSPVVEGNSQGGPGTDSGQPEEPQQLLQPQVVPMCVHATFELIFSTS